MRKMKTVELEIPPLKDYRYVVFDQLPGVLFLNSIAHMPNHLSVFRVRSVLRPASLEWLKQQQNPQTAAKRSDQMVSHLNSLR